MLCLFVVALIGAAAAQQTIYDFNVEDLDGRDVSLSKYRSAIISYPSCQRSAHSPPQTAASYALIGVVWHVLRGQVVVMVNVASYCGLTRQNYRELKELDDKYYDQGLRIAAFPCNQFYQEPQPNAAIKSFVSRLVSPVSLPSAQAKG